MQTDLYSIPILAAGRGWLVAEKPAGVSVQEKQGTSLCSILASTIKNDPILRSQVDCEVNFGWVPVHRLDRETSGVILLACRAEVFTYFSMQFETRKVEKRYIALVHGDLSYPHSKSGWGIWEWPLSENAGGRLHPEGPGRTVPCRTRFRILRRSPHYTLIECDLLSGRKHQVRRHARLAGHAVVGDARYGTTRSVRFLREKLDFARLALHSYSLEIRLPGEEPRRLFRSEEIPREILRLLEKDSG
jgi:23S rRNA-/tRNA-specific pseudouridylate synthase